MTGNNRLFADEEVESPYVYPECYQVRDVEDQIYTLSSLFGVNLQISDEQWALVKTRRAERIKPPPYTDGFFAFPRWKKFAATYGEAVELVLALIASRQPLRNLYQGSFGADYFRRYPNTSKMMGRVGNRQNQLSSANITIAPFQSGIHYAGRSPRRVRAILPPREFGLGAFEAGCILLSYPTREVWWEHLHIDCPGDEVSPEANGNFSGVPTFAYFDGALEFSIDSSTRVAKCFGSATAFAEW